MQALGELEEMMRFLVILSIMLCSLTVNAKETRCGWLENPTAANLWLIDKDKSWDISFQGGPNNIDEKSIDLVYEGLANKNDFVRTNGNYGFSCACLSVDLDKEKMFIKTIYKVKQLPLKQCLEDITITKAIPLRFK
ncbi:DUF4087 domain-containing protein [Aliivibrio logei]|uniref:DUF4087 domain-containing protein n=1 Tax=Aliivibrio logei TaxID=688 RepID=UPI0003C7A072|nr:DUF4087 domain-containing protein [Aliivibrio logei]